MLTLLADVAGLHEYSLLTPGGPQNWIELCGAVSVAVERDPTVELMAAQNAMWTVCTFDLSQCPIAAIPGFGCVMQKAAH